MTPEIDPVLFAVLVSDWLWKHRRCSVVREGRRCRRLATHGEPGTWMPSLSCDEHARDPVGRASPAEPLPGVDLARRAEKWLADFNASRTA